MFQTVYKLKQELLSLEPLKDSDRRRLDEKFRLEFNYNSNHMEGNTLTYQDTKVLLLKDILPQGKMYHMRELEEMKAHDVGYAMIKEWAADPEREITERDIRDLNKIILVKDFYKDAITPEGQPTRKLIKAGEYKSDLNSVLLANGEIFHYADPVDVPVKMQELMDWYRDEKTSLHPITLAAVFHHKFVLIHPFDDGNGRISRLLMNYILLKNGFPPIVIKSAEKQKYLNALRLADAGNLEAFITFIGEQMVWSLEVSIKAAKGEEITEPDDWKKELNIWVKELDSFDNYRTFENTYERIQDSVVPLLKELRSVVFDNFQKLFENLEINCFFEGCIFSIDSILESPDTYNIKKLINPYVNQHLNCNINFNQYSNKNSITFNIRRTLVISFKNNIYQILIDTNEPTYYITKKINSSIIKDEMSEIVNEFCFRAVNEIKDQISKNQKI